MMPFAQKLLFLECVEDSLQNLQKSEKHAFHADKVRLTIPCSAGFFRKLWQPK